MNDQGSNTDSANGQGSAATNEQKAPTAPNADALAASVADLEARLRGESEARAKLEKENYAFRERERQRKASDDESRKKSGDYEGMLKERDDQIAALTKQVADTEGAAQAWRAFEEAESKSIAEAAKDLDDVDKSVLSAIGDLRLRRQALDRLVKGKGGGSANRPKSIDDAIPGGTDDTIESLTRAGKTVAEMMQTHPHLFDQYTSGKPASGVLSMFASKKKTASK